MKSLTPFIVGCSCRRSEFTRAGSGRSILPTASSRLTLKPQSFACSGVGVGSFGAILLCTPDAHNRWCVTSQICKSNRRINVSSKPGGPRNMEQSAYLDPRGGRPRTEGHCRTDHVKFCSAVRTHNPHRASCQWLEPRPSNRVRCFPRFSEAKKISETHRGAGAWYVTVIVCETKSDGFP